MKSPGVFLALTLIIPAFGNGTSFGAQETVQKAAEIPVRKTVEAETPAKPSGKEFLLKTPVKKPAGSMEVLPTQKEPSPAQVVNQGPVPSWFIPPLASTYHFVTPFSGLPNGWVEMANISDEGSNVIVKVYDRNGELREGQAFRMAPHSYVRTRELFGGRDIPEIADPAVVEVKSLQPLCVFNCRYRSGSQAWGFDVWPTYYLGASGATSIPVSGFSNAKLEIANPWDVPWTARITYSTGAGEVIRSYMVEIPGHGYRSTMDEDIVGGNLYDNGTPLVVSVSSDLPLAITLARWDDNRGWGTTALEYVSHSKSSFPFGSPSSEGPPSGALWPNGWMEAVFKNRTGLLDIFNPVQAQVRNRAGELARERSTGMTTEKAYVNSRTILEGQILDFASPAAASLEPVRPAGVAIYNLLQNSCATRWSASSGCAYPVETDSLYTQIILEPQYEFPVNGFANAAVEFTNVGDSNARVTLTIYNETGAFQGRWLADADLAPNGYLSTWDEVWRRTDTGGLTTVGALDIYEIAKPCVVKVETEGGRVKVAHTRWSDWGAAGFAPFPTYVLDNPTPPRIEVGEPTGGGFMGTIGGGE